MNKVSFLTLGCKVNQYETEAMQELFKKRGYEICNENDICDVYVINTCTVTNLSDRKSRQFISRAKKLNKDAILAVVGCYSQVAPDEISAIEDVDVIIGTKNRARIVELCEESKKSNLKFNIVSELTKDCGFDVLSIENQESKTRAYIKIQEGCNMFCTYCIIPHARGPIKSRPIDDIYEEAVKLANNGYKEVIITGIHVGSYGLDLGNDTRLIDVIEKLSTIENIDRIRLSSIEAGIISRDFLERLKNCKKVCEHFHLSLQSGCDKILKLMNRRYTTDMYRKKVRMIKEIFPNVALTTDVIVGFPGETEEDFEDTLSMVEKVGYDQGFTFLYSIRKGTKAAEMQNQIPHEVKQERFQRLIDSMYKIFYEKNKECLGQTLEVLVEGISKNNPDILTGRTRGYKLVHFKGGSRNIGQLVNIKITGHNSFALEGEIV